MTPKDTPTHKQQQDLTYRPFSFLSCYEFHVIFIIGYQILSACASNGDVELYKAKLTGYTSWPQYKITVKTELPASNTFRSSSRGNSPTFSGTGSFWNIRIQYGFL